MMFNFVGDINFSDAFFDVGCGIGTKIQNGIDPFKYCNFVHKDVYIGNLECVIANKTNKKGIYAKQFIIEPNWVDKIISTFDIYSISNNHVLEHGADAYQTMCNYLKHKKRTIVGNSENRHCIYVKEGIRLGIVSWSLRNDWFCKSPKEYFFRPNETQLLNELNNIKDCDIKITLIHWGEEFIQFPSLEQQKYGKYLIDLGFNLVIGHHSHTLQGYEDYNGGRIYYSLGNFLFDIAYKKTRYSAIVSIRYINNKIIFNHQYIKQNKDGFPVKVSEVEVPNEYKFSYLNELINTKTEKMSIFEYNKNVKKELKNYQKVNYLSFTKSIFKGSIINKIQLIIDFIKRKFN